MVGSVMIVARLGTILKDGMRVSRIPLSNEHTQECIDYNMKVEHDTPGECICSDNHPLTAKVIEENRKNPDKLAKIIEDIEKLIALEEHSRLNYFKLKWEITRQMHIILPRFWLEDIEGLELTKVYKAWRKEYTIVFGKNPPFGIMIHDIAEWKYSQRKKYNKEKEKID